MFCRIVARATGMQHARYYFQGVKHDNHLDAVHCKCISTTRWTGSTASLRGVAAARVRDGEASPPPSRRRRCGGNAVSPPVRRYTLSRSGRYTRATNIPGDTAIAARRELAHSPCRDHKLRRVCGIATGSPAVASQ